MSRKTNTVEWFPHYANASSKMTLTILEKKYGIEGYAVWFKLLECLASTDGHYIICQNKIHLDYLTSRLSVSNGNLTSMLQDMANLSAIDKDLWDNHKIIWSDNFIQGVKEVYDNRKRESPTKPNPLPLPTTNLPVTYLREEGEEGRKELEEVEEKVDDFTNHTTTPENKDLEITHIKIDDEGNPLPPEKKQRKNEDYGKYGNDIKKVFESLDKARGYRTTKRAIESAAICRMLKKNYTIAQINDTWCELKKDKYWASHELFMMTVEGQIGAIVNKTTQGGGYNELKQQLTTPKTDVNPFGNIKSK